MTTQQALLIEALAHLTVAADALEAGHIKVSEALAMLTPVPPEPEHPIVEPPEPVDPGPIEPPVVMPEAPAGYPKEPPRSGRMLDVPEDYDTIQAALQVARPGDEISVSANYKTGALTLTKPFDPANKVIIRSRVTGKAIIDRQVKINAPGYWLHGFQCTHRESVEYSGGGAILLNADHCNLTKLEIQSPSGVTSMDPKRHHINIGWCLFNGMNTGDKAVSNIYFKIPLGGQGKLKTDNPNHIHIYRNDFHDDATRKAGAMEDHCIYFGDSKTKDGDVLCMDDVDIYQNLIRRGNNRVRGIYMKRSCSIRQNMLPGGKYNWGFRVGGDGLVEGNNAIGPMKLVICGPRNRIVNNRCSDIHLYAGSSKNGAMFYVAADGAFLDGNEATLLVGYIPGALDQNQGGRTGNVVVCAHKGGITWDARGCDRATCREAEASRGGYLPVLNLTPSDVGLVG